MRFHAGTNYMEQFDSMHGIAWNRVLRWILEITESGKVAVISSPFL